MDVESGAFGSCPKPDCIVTSPPYANRLDYTRMWAPELEVVSAMYGVDCRGLKAKALGTTVVHGKIINADEEIGLPKVVRASLKAIRDDRHSKASDSYYYPFFRNYAVGLALGLRCMAKHLHRRGKLLVFVRDTARKDVLFPTGALVRGVLRSSGLSEIDSVRKVIREHIGLRRRASTKGLYGLAQQEWWLAFQKQ
jgi:hypothetical protein